MSFFLPIELCVSSSQEFGGDSAWTCGFQGLHCYFTDLIMCRQGRYSSGLTEMDGSQKLKGIVQIQRYSRLRLINSYPNQVSEAKTNKSNDLKIWIWRFLEIKVLLRPMKSKFRSRRRETLYRPILRTQNFKCSSGKEYDWYRGTSHSLIGYFVIPI